MVGAAPTSKGGAKDLGTPNEFKDIKRPSIAKKIIKGIIVFTVLALVVGAGAAVLVFNVFDIRDTHLRPFIEPIPWVGDLLPPLANGDIVPQATVPELEAQILALQTSLDIMTADNTQLNSVITAQSADIVSMGAQLAEFEAEHETFTQNQEEFYRMVAGEAPMEFTQFFETMNPALATSLFEEIVGTQALEAEIEGYVNLMLELSTRNAADVLQEMISGQLPLVISILEATPLAPRGTLINAMNLENRTLVMTMLAQDIEW